MIRIYGANKESFRNKLFLTSIWFSTEVLAEQFIAEGGRLCHPSLKMYWGDPAQEITKTKTNE